MAHTHSNTVKTSKQSPPSENGISRKRVGKACDRCRLKKSKCDGHLPCQRCLVDDQICVFSERKRTKDKVYPKGYVELLESRTQTLADAIYRILYCQQQNIDISHLLPKDNRIVINEVLAKLEPLKKIPDGFSCESYTDDLLEKFILEQRLRKGSSQSDPESLASDLSSNDENFPPSPTSNSLSPSAFDFQLFTQDPSLSKFVPFDTIPSLPTSIAPSLLMADYNLGQSPHSLDLDYSLLDDSPFMDTRRF